MKIKLRSHPYRVKHGQPKWIEVDAKVFGNFAVHESLDNRTNFDVSHVRSGQKVLDHLKKRKAQWAASELNELCGKKSVKELRLLMKEIQAIGKKYRGT